MRVRCSKAAFALLFVFLVAVSGFSTIKISGGLWNISSQNGGQCHPAVIVHGGAGSAQPGKVYHYLVQKWKEGLYEAVDTARTLLLKDSPAIRAVIAAIMKLEDNLLFNAGRGSCAYFRWKSSNGRFDHVWA